MSAAAEVAWTALGIALATLLLDALRVVPALDDYVHLLTAALFLVVAVRGSQRQPDGITRYGLSLGGLLDAEAADYQPPTARGAVLELAHALAAAVPAGLRAIAAALLTALVVFPPFIVGYGLYHGVLDGLQPAPLPNPVDFGLAQLLVVALPEEALFRGYFQGRLSDLWPRCRRILGVPLSVPATLAQCALFALLHVAVQPHPARLMVFFPALLFTWLSQRQGGVGAAIVFHALCNTLSELLARAAP